MWPFAKHKPKIRYEIGSSYITSGFGFRLKITADGEEVLSEYVSLMSIDAHNDRIDKLQQDHYRKLKALESVIKAATNQTKQQSSIWHVLGCMPTTDRAVVEKSYRRMAMVYHPDHGGTSSSFQTLNKAKELALAKCK